MCRLISIETNFNTKIEVADIKKDVIENIIEAASVCTRICQIILFGSVIGSRCTEDSDVDMLVISDTSRSRLYKDKSYQEFLKRLHDRDDYKQIYDVICVHGMEEVYQYRNKVNLFQNILNCGKTLYRRV
ncbi:MAG: nucleotidyltransferase domain-containing protein [Lachnoclostridium sp.]|nr:nucleotidyltransferase domain-containing protein [Lachnospira sp.]MCM1247516.1 nucleotidyltransferase domain-containing protein [Lachnoclostridium sp.]MCM1464882.1 nucleotidyltransferase domain-containing protein [Bacteroidales bacterium]MCM1536754.1 nucleotidyltransferase domain-containing protein [Clostridium sp.]MCM1325228.1 nucleotidyltransferase domain-containing protein [Lachnoclostridium sp.]